jgi:hypothetical protein
LKKAKKPNRCNVLAQTPPTRHLWQFSADGERPKLEANVDVPIGKPAPANLVAKSWQTLMQPRVNLAWLPAENVFLRVVQLPQADPSELASMLEFQLEKLSPLPVAQIVWSFEIVPSSEINNITAIVIIVARDLIEERIGTLEKEGYQPDRIEMPHLYQLVADAPMSEGVWVYPWSEGGKDFCIVAWWFTGTMRNLQLIHLPTAGDRAGMLKEQLLKTAWAGEMEGWLNYPLRWHVVAQQGGAAEWTSVFADLAEGGATVLEQMSRDQLAEFSARRTVQATPAANLLPPEFSERYRQQFWDRLWMRGLGVLVGIYLIILIGYFGAVQFFRIRVATVQKSIAGISQSYTNTLRLQERVQVLEDQLNLKYAALDCWKTASDLLPTDLTLNQLVFGRGQTLELRGIAENAKALADYNDAMRGATIDGRPLFKSVTPPTSSTRAGSTQLSWAFTCEINRLEGQ